MQQRSCEQIGLLLSKYTDGEASPAERQKVESHVAACPECAQKLAEYSQLNAILSGSPLREPEPALRVDLFREIRHIREEEDLAQRQAQERPGWLPVPHVPRRRASNTFARAWTIASPFVAASAAVFTILGLAIFFSNTRSPQVLQVIDTGPFEPVPTAAAPVAMQNDSSAIQPVSTQSARVPGLMSPSVPAELASATAFATAIAEGIFQLSQATPVLEETDPAKLDPKNHTSWHAFRDPAYGYAISYPPNWWTYASGNSRTFAPWWTGALRGIPYRIEVHVEANTQGLTAANANGILFGGQARVVKNRQGSAVGLLRTTSDATASYHEFYSFDQANVYTLRLVVTEPGYWSTADAVFSQMSGTFSLAGRVGTALLGYAPMLFLNGTDLYMIEPDGTSRAVSHGYGVRQFALSPDMTTVAFTAAKTSADTWASTLYSVQINGDSVGTPTAIWAGAQEIHDIAWYSDRELVAIAQGGQSDLGIYRISIERSAPNMPPENAEPSLIVSLPGDMAGARGLSVSPDRQLITFLAPLGEHAGTDIYAVRPDGNDLQMMISHTDPVSPSDSNGRIYTPDSQAIKSYEWVNGYLDSGGYRFHLLLTCGNSASPTFFRGGFLYSAPGAMSNVLLNQNQLSIPDANKMQIVHIAYSNGRVALTGYYSDRNGRADVLAGLWVGTIGATGVLSGVRAFPVPNSPDGIADLQWSPDGRNLVYRETVPQEASSLSSRYDEASQSPFSIIEVDPASGDSTVLYSTH